MDSNFLSLLLNNIGFIFTFIGRVIAVYVAWGITENRIKRGYYYFNQQKPTGFSIAPPYNLNLKQVLCYVFMPASLLINGSSQVYIRLFVKDTKYANDFSKSYTVDSAHVNTGSQFPSP